MMMMMNISDLNERAMLAGAGRGAAAAVVSFRSGFWYLAVGGSRNMLFYFNFVFV
jgi:hypothetical protein